MAFKKGFQERLGDNGKGDKIQVERVPNTMFFFDKSSYLRKSGDLNILRSIRLREIMGRFPQDSPSSHLFHVLFDEQSQKVGPSCLYLLTQNSVEPMTGRKFT